MDATCCGTLCCHSARLAHSLDARPVCTQPPLLQSSSMYTDVHYWCAASLHGQLTAGHPSISQPLPTYMMGTQSAMLITYAIYMQVGLVGHTAFNPFIHRPGRSQTESIHASAGAQHNWPIHLGLPHKGIVFSPGWFSRQHPCTPTGDTSRKLLA